MADRSPIRNQMPTSLTPEEFGQLFDAFLDAFNSKSSLERVVAFSFTGVDLADIGDGDLRTVSAALIRWAVAQDSLPTLIAGARRENAGNKKLEAVETYWRNRPTPLQSVSNGGTPELQGVPIGSASTVPTAHRGQASFIRYGIGILAVVCVIGAAWWLTHRDGTALPTPLLIDSFPRNATGKWYGSSWITNPNRVIGVAEPSPNGESGFLRFRPQGRLAPAEAERALGDGASGLSLEPYCALDFRLRLGLDGVNSFPAGADGASVYIKQGDAENALALKEYVPNPESSEWQTVEIPRRAFERVGLDAALPVSALGFKFAMPLGNIADIDDIAFNPCPANG